MTPQAPTIRPYLLIFQPDRDRPLTIKTWIRYHRSQHAARTSALQILDHEYNGAARLLAVLPIQD